MAEGPSAIISDPLSPLDLGRTEINYGLLDGRLDDVAFFPFALDADDVAALSARSR